MKKPTKNYESKFKMTLLKNIDFSSLQIDLHPNELFMKKPFNSCVTNLCEGME